MLIWANLLVSWVEADFAIGVCWEFCRDATHQSSLSCDWPVSSFGFCDVARCFNELTRSRQCCSSIMAQFYLRFPILKSLAASTLFELVEDSTAMKHPSDGLLGQVFARLRWLLHY
jgi:hypothetical protein